MAVLVRFRLLLAVMAFLVPKMILGFVPLAFRSHPHQVCRKSMTATEQGVEDEEAAVEPEEEAAFQSLFEKEEVPFAAEEKVWRHAKKPLLRIGSKGATHAHGNSLRQLLDDHTVVKVKVNTKKFGTLENASTSLRDLAVENGASKDIEIVQMREKDKTIMFGLPGTMEQVKDGSFPPPPPPPYEPRPYEPRVSSE